MVISVYPPANATVDVDTKIRLTARPAAAWSEVSPVWEMLADASGQSSVFLTRVWTETWLESFADVTDPSLLVFESGGIPVGACIITSSTRRRALLSIHRRSLNTAGEPDDATAYIEFNSVLCRPGWERAVVALLTDYLRGLHWDEVWLNGFCDGPSLQAIREAFGDLASEVSVRPSCYVDLAAMRASARAYEACLGSTTRKHLRQNLRHYAGRGALSVCAAREPVEAIQMFDRLAALHQQRWEKRGRAGAFASARFRRFHESLIQRAFPLGAVQLLEVSAGEHTIGLIYNLVHRGKVYFYQAGFNYDDDGRASPGTVTLYHAIQYCSEVGLNEFDFLAGDDQYKKSLSTGCRHLVWAAFRRPHWKFRVLDWLRRVNTLAKHSGRRSAL